MHRRSVLLPLPLGPRMQTTSPRLTDKLMPRRTSSVPKFLCKSSTTTILPAPASAGASSGIRAHPTLGHAHRVREPPTKEEVDEGKHREHLEGTKGARGDDLRAIGEIRNAE